MGKAEKLALDIERVLVKGGFTVKGFTIAGRAPPLALSTMGSLLVLLG